MAPLSGLDVAQMLDVLFISYCGDVESSVNVLGSVIGLSTMPVHCTLYTLIHKTVIAISTV